MYIYIYIYTHTYTHIYAQFGLRYHQGPNHWSQTSSRIAVNPRTESLDLGGLDSGILLMLRGRVPRSARGGSRDLDSEILSFRFLVVTFPQRGIRNVLPDPGQGRSGQFWNNNNQESLQHIMFSYYFNADVEVRKWPAEPGAGRTSSGIKNRRAHNIPCYLISTLK